MNLAERAYRGLFPDSSANYIFHLNYNGRFKDFGANARMAGNLLELNLSKKWIGVAEEIQMGLMQELILRLVKKRGSGSTMYIDLYNSFVKNLHLAIPKTKSDPVLEESFNRVNDQYFLGLVERPNLRWGGMSTTTFGTYDFKVDTVTISKIFQFTDPLYLDYIMFHEVLHKQRKFRRSGSKTYYHDSTFRRAEKVFRDSERIEKSLGRVAAKARLKAMFRFR
ncbi:TPA: hypothetical protein HA265_00995 [Candidatus Woesearchaeota archaeon]|nr:hypothetical protein [Candidatus Woesearchaeota archaeon]